jgi:hypothetical protein
MEAIVYLIPSLRSVVAVLVLIIVLDDPVVLVVEAVLVAQALMLVARQHKEIAAVQLGSALQGAPHLAQLIHTQPQVVVVLEQLEDLQVLMLEHLAREVLAEHRQLQAHQ